MDRQHVHALGWFSRFAAVGAVALPVTFAIGVGQQPGDVRLGAEFAELVQAGRALTAYRIALLCDSCVWCLFAVTLALLARLLREAAPVRSTLILLFAAGTLIGAMTGCIRLALIVPLAERLAANASAVQAAQDGFQMAVRLGTATALLGNLMLGLGFSLAAWATRSFTDLPQWLSAWMLLTGAIPLIQVVLVAAGQGFALPLIIAEIVVGYAGLSAAMAIVLRRA